MILARTFTVLAMAAAIGLVASPVDADQRRGRSGGDRGGQRAARPANRDAGRGAVRRTAPPAQRSVAPRAAQPRTAQPRRPPQAVQPRAARPRGSFGGPIVTLPRSGRNWGTVSPHGWRSGPVVIFRGSRGWYPYRSYGPPVRYVRPYYSFRPRFSLSIGLWAGFSVPFPGYGYIGPYPYGYPAPYAYPVPYPVPYPSPYPVGAYPSQVPPGTVSAVPGSYGGISFEITPEDAEVWVDGGYAGRANEFGPYAQPLALAPGPHRVELRAPGYRVLSFDVTVVTGQVIPYQGVLPPGL